MCVCSSPLFHLTRSGLFRTPGAFERAAHIDVVVVVPARQVVVAAGGVGEGRQVEGEFCGATEAS